MDHALKKTPDFQVRVGVRTGEQETSQWSSISSHTK